MDVRRAIQIIQVHERARQGRVRARLMQSIRAEEERERRLRDQPTVSYSAEEAAIQIQRIVRGFLARRRARRVADEELELIGMTMPPALSRKEDPILKAEQAAEQRRVTQVCASASRERR